MEDNQTSGSARTIAIAIVLGITVLAFVYGLYHFSLHPNTLSPNGMSPDDGHNAPTLIVPPIVLPFFFLLFVGATFVWRPWVVWRTSGVNPFVPTRGDSAHDYVVRLFRIDVVLALLVVLIYGFVPQFYEYLAPIRWLEKPWIGILGYVLLTVALLWTVLAQIQMGSSLRIGIDDANKTVLVQTGVFAISRNPIFLGLVVALLGLFLVAPGALTLLVFALGVALIGVQVRLEEMFLTRVHGDAYQEYANRVRRWM